MYYLNTASHVPVKAGNDDLIRNAISKMYNPSDDGEYAENAKSIIASTKKEIIRSISKSIDFDTAMNTYDVIFTSSGSAANNLAIAQFDDVITTPIEHSSIHDNPNVKQCVELGSCGYVNLAKLYDKDFSLFDGISVHYVNNELGIIQPIKEIVDVAHEYNVYVHVDAVQAYGNIDIDIVDLGVDFMSLSGHKIGALSGIGCLVVRKSLIDIMKPLIYGEQEHGLFGGTENLIGIYSWNVALRDFAVANANNKKNFIAYFDSAMKENKISYVINPFNKDYCNFYSLMDEGRYDNKTISFAFDGVNGESLKLALEIYGVIVSNGSACNTGKDSYVLQAIDTCKSNVYNTIRISLPNVECTEQTKRDMKNICEIIVKAVKRVRKM